MSPRGVPLLTVHLVAHPRCREAEHYSRELVSDLFESPNDLTAHGMRIPVRIWRGRGDGTTMSAPAPINLDAAEHSVVVVLVDAHFVIGDGWLDFLAELTEACDGERHLVLPVALSPAALRLVSPASQLNWIRAFDRKVLAVRRRFVLNRITHSLYRLLENEPLTVFVSHAKLDGEGLASEARTFLSSGTGVRDWFDAQDLPFGSRWVEQIRGAASRNLLLVIRSDAYATREWCRIEVLEAKLAGSPVVVLDALKLGERRSFPYLGNGPVVRWTGRRQEREWERVLAVVLLEALRFSYFPRRVAWLCRLNMRPTPDRVFARPPELMTVLKSRPPGSAGQWVLVYPDPPLGAEEMDLLVSTTSDLVPITPTLLLAGYDVSSVLGRFDGLLVGMSVSDSPDLSQVGLSQGHLEHAYIELARQFLAAGVSLAYGGDLRGGGFTEKLVDLLYAYSTDDRPVKDRVRQYLAWPLHAGHPDHQDQAERMATLFTVATVTKVEKPVVAKSVPKDIYVRVEAAEAFSMMRRRMTDDIDARVVLGGQIEGFQGRMPGVAEEGLLAVAAGKPVYLLGGFGGAANRLVRLLRDDDPDPLNLTALLSRSRAYEGLLDGLGHAESNRLLSALRGAGSAALRNGLSEAENAILFESADIDNVVALVLRGLVRIGQA